jgi:hypothetical protein
MTLPTTDETPLYCTVSYSAYTRVLYLVESFVSLVKSCQVQANRSHATRKGTICMLLSPLACPSLRPQPAPFGTQLHAFVCGEQSCLGTLHQNLNIDVRVDCFTCLSRACRSSFCFEPLVFGLSAPSARLLCLEYLWPCKPRSSLNVRQRANHRFSSRLS